jgi:hypothetical protein
LPARPQLFSHWECCVAAGVRGKAADKVC